MRKSFTMIEIVFVLVITGLVGVAGSMAIVQIMQNYAIQKEYAKTELDGTSAIRQVSRYLQNSVWDSIAIRNGVNYTAISNVNMATDGLIGNNTELIFIEKNEEVMNGAFGTYQGDSSNIPYFSGFINLADSQGTTMVTAFRQDRLDTISSLARSIALYFPFIHEDGNVVNKFYAFPANNRTSLFVINQILGNNRMILGRVPRQVGDIAVIVNIEPSVISRDTNNDLKLIKNGVTTTLAQNVSSFSIWSESSGGLFRIRLCFANSTMDFMPEFCKEGVVMQ